LFPEKEVRKGEEGKGEVKSEREKRERKAKEGVKSERGK
jgi:hypothetical protein